MVVRDYNDAPSNFRYTKTLSELLEESGVPGIQGIDTRKLVRTIRDKGSMKACLTDESVPDKEVMKRIAEYTYPTDQVDRAGCKKRWYSRTPNHRYNVVAVDCGIKNQMVRNLNNKGCNVIVVPHTISADDVLALKPDGVFLSNGPGDPVNVPEVVELVKALKGKVPHDGRVHGASAHRARVRRKDIQAESGHRGGNHPILDKTTGFIEITAQNHSYAVDEKSPRGHGA